MLKIIDPPEGWKYGFPKIFDADEKENVEDWFVKNGYPQKLIDEGMLDYCRTWFDNELLD